MDKRIYTLDGRHFSTLETFYDDVGTVLIPGADWGRNLDAFNDILRGGFGTPDGGFRIRWIHSALSRVRLGHAETARQLAIRLERCHPSNRTMVEQLMLTARNGIGPTVYDWLVEIIRKHDVGGNEAGDGVELVLE